MVWFHLEMGTVKKNVAPAKSRRFDLETARERDIPKEQLCGDHPTYHVALPWTDQALRIQSVRDKAKRPTSMPHEQ